MRTADLGRLLLGIGFEAAREGNGHILFRSPKSQVVLPVHKGESLKPSTIRLIEDFSIRMQGGSPSGAHAPEASYSVLLRRVEGEQWVATVPSLFGCLTQARNVRQALERIREAILLFRDDAGPFELTVELDVPGISAEALSELTRAREKVTEVQAELERRLEEAKGELEQRTRATAAAITAAGLDPREAALLMGMSSRELSRVLTDRPDEREATAG